MKSNPMVNVPSSDESFYITGTDIVVDGGWFSSAPYLTNERSHHMLKLLDTKDKAKHALDDFLKQRGHTDRRSRLGRVGTANKVVAGLLLCATCGRDERFRSDACGSS